jgi:hypothetical protein
MSTLHTNNCIGNKNIIVQGRAENTMECVRETCIDTIAFILINFLINIPEKNGGDGNY